MRNADTNAKTRRRRRRTRKSAQRAEPASSSTPKLRRSRIGELRTWTRAYKRVPVQQSISSQSTFRTTSFSQCLRYEQQRRRVSKFVGVADASRACRARFILAPFTFRHNLVQVKSPSSTACIRAGTWSYVFNDRRRAHGREAMLTAAYGQLTVC